VITTTETIKKKTIKKKTKTKKNKKYSRFTKQVALNYYPLPK
jgi:hypothetical protein